MTDVIPVRVFCPQGFQHVINRFCGKESDLIERAGFFILWGAESVFESINRAVVRSIVDIWLGQISLRDIAVHDGVCCSSKSILGIDSL